MEGFVIEVQKRTEAGSSANRRYRNAGLLPAIVYHRGEASQPTLIEYRSFVNLASRSRKTQVFALKSSEANLDGRSVFVREIQRHPVSGKLLHVDLQALKDDEEISVSVPVKAVGESPGVKLDGGVLSIILHELPVRCLPKNIPIQIEVDISGLKLGHSVHASDLKLAQGVRLDIAPEEAILAVQIPRSVIEETTAAAATPADGAVAGAAAPGAAAAATPAAGAAAGAGAQPAAAAKPAAKK